jgi:sialic acid synthase SpsE/sugar phosphate isomerase/epimerase
MISTISMHIADFEIGTGRTFVIAEIGNNHNGSFTSAINLIDKAQAAGADCVKFQMRHLDQVYRHRSLKKNGEDLGTEYVIDLLNKFELSVEEHRKLSDYCFKINMLYLCTPWDAVSADTLESFAVPAYKVASADLTNLPLIQRLIETKKPLILSTGMNTADEVEVTVNFLKKRAAEFVLLHCNSTYPAPLHDINLKWMATLRRLHPLIGYSGHERGINISLAATALDACIIERHFTLDREMEGPDHAASLLPAEFANMVAGIREIELAKGLGERRQLSQGEMINRENLGKSLVAALPLARGTILMPHHVKVRSPGQGLSPQKYEALLGRTVHRDIEDEGFFFPSDLQDSRLEPGSYSFSRPWGLPVRYHDFQEYASRVVPDLWEFHLSYSDMELDPSKYLTIQPNTGFVVHAPELFSGSRLMDLATPDEAYRNDSIRETQRVIDITRALKTYFPTTACPMIVANIGGFTMDATLAAESLQGYYERFADSLSKLDLAGVELIPQTMAPFPWHFGGQRYQNLFVKANEIVEWCSRLKLRMCFDVSHSSLASNHFEMDFYDFALKVAPFTAHLHLGDAAGVNGEGLQIGEGALDFARLGQVLKKGCPHASFIPEIWQGHKNGGEGFWIALNKLERLL